ncbi:MAG: PTS sugar transporter subunit IIC [Oscillospiraceae bacterium]|nr:PTS sugar transporter subunit IIC [Oscillospiraceae bacterium]
MKVKNFLQKKKIDLSWKNYFVTAMGAMAQGLFASLLIGTILGTLGNWTGWAFLNQIADFAKNNYVVGAAIGVAVAAALKAEGLVLFSCAVVGAIGYVMGAEIPVGDSVISYTAGPAGSFFAVLVACECGKLVSKETKIDILVTPIVTILVGFGISLLLCPLIAYAMYYLGNFINTATELHPFVMGIIVSVVVGILLTLPISSAAICAMIGISGLAGGAATAGCCCQMIGFAVMSFRENRWGGLTAQGLGTSMLQMGNIIKRPVIWLPTILSSAIVGPIATVVFKMVNTGVSAGMGTCGLVGPLGVITATGSMDWFSWLGLVLCCFILPAVLTLLFSELMRKLGWIRQGDLKLDL